MTRVSVPTTEGAPMPGGCLCGRVRFEIEPPSRFLAHCHCDNCRRAHGAVFVTWLGVPAEQMRWTSGEPALVRYRTDTGATRSFCGTCGTTLTYESPRWPGEVHVAAGCLDGAPDRAPQAHVYTGHKAEWYDIPDDGLPRLGGESGTEPVS